MSFIIQSNYFDNSTKKKDEDKNIDEILKLKSKFPKFQNFINSESISNTKEILNNYESEIPIISMLFHIKIEKKESNESIQEKFSELIEFVKECRIKRKINSFIAVYYDTSSCKSTSSSSLELFPIVSSKLFQNECSLVTYNYQDILDSLKIVEETSIEKSGNLKCPICSQSGFASELSEDDLREHIYLFHCNVNLKDIESRIPVCPICFVRPIERFGVHLHEVHGPKGEKPESQLSISKIYPFCLVIVRKKSNNTFLIVNEAAGRGYWLPGGKLNYNESLQQCAIRECKEETGIDIEIKGILRFEYSPYMQYSRMRVIFYAEPIDENQPPRLVPNYESMGGLWVSTKDLNSLPLRGKEPTIWFNYVEKGKDIYPLSILQLENAIPR